MAAAYFALPQSEELLIGALARTARNLGVVDDKVVLDYFFGSRMIVPSALFQGHLLQLLSNVGHLWNVDPSFVMQHHSLLPLFRPFVGRSKYNSLESDLLGAQTNPFSFRSGVNASIVRWPTHFKVCPFCWRETKSRLGYAVWQRLFQCLGVECCPEHKCRLITTKLRFQSDQRHHMVGAFEAKDPLPVSQTASYNSLELARLVQQLLQYSGAIPEVSQWSCYYSRLASDENLMHGQCIAHTDIRSKVLNFWGSDWLCEHGLGLEHENNWLLGMFRKHRRPFSYLQHLICWMSLQDKRVDVPDVIAEVNKLSGVAPLQKTYSSAYAPVRKHAYRQQWLQLLEQECTLKAIRLMRDGARVYSWLYRFDRDWLTEHKPKRHTPARKMKVDWCQRDRELVKKLIGVRNQFEDDLSVERKSCAWYSKKIYSKALWERHNDKLPLCKEFMIRYAETVDEYQTRRLGNVMIGLINAKSDIISRSEIERLSGLSKERCRPAARRIIESELSTWQSYQQIPRQCKA